MRDNNKREFKLNISKNWNVWLSIIKIKTHGQKIWNLIDFFIITKLFNQFNEFVKSDLNKQQDANFNEKHVKYQIALKRYKQNYKKYERQKKDLAKVTNFILFTINVINIIYIQKMKMHFWNQLKILKTRLAFIIVARNFELEQQYHRLVKGFSNRQSVDQWFDDFMKMYIFDVKIEIIECTNETRVYRDFLLNIEKLAFIFVEMRQILFAALIDHHAIFIKGIDDFRQHMRLKEVQKDTEIAHSHFAFATDDDKLSFKEKRQTFQTCICEFMHWFFEMFLFQQRQ